MSPRNKIPASNTGSKGNLTCPPCPYCGFLRCWKHGKYFRKGFHRSTAGPPQEPVAIQRFLCRNPRCGRTFSVLPEKVLPYCRFSLDDLLVIADDKSEGKSSYWIAKHRWGLSLRIILRAVILILKVSDWLAGVCREAACSVVTGFRALIETAMERLSWFDLTRRWFHGLYPCRSGNILHPHNLGIKRL